VCVLTVCTFDHSDASLTSKDDNWKRGDVVQITEDGANVGAALLSNSAFRICSVPGVAASKYLNLLAADTVKITDPNNSSMAAIGAVVRKRHFTFNLTAAETGRVILSNNQVWPSKTITMQVVPLTEANLVSFCSAKAPLTSTQILTTLGLPLTYVVTPDPAPSSIT
jgi:hypothetical protein